MAVLGSQQRGPGREWSRTLEVTDQQQGPLRERWTVGVTNNSTTAPPARPVPKCLLPVSLNHAVIIDVSV